MRCINCSYNNIAKGIRLLDKIAIFVYAGKKFTQVRAFESNFSLNQTNISVPKHFFVGDRRPQVLHYAFAPYVVPKIMKYI